MDELKSVERKHFDDVDPCSLSNTSAFTTKHLNWNIDIDFKNKVLQCTAKLTVVTISEVSNKLFLDTNGLVIERVSVDEAATEFELLPEIAPFGRPLKITVPQNKASRDSVFKVSILYKTTPGASALQWLSPDQTLEKKHPYLFTQCQAIHARSIVPCQDSPSKKITYHSCVTVGSEMVALMSAVKGEEREVGNGRKASYFKQDVAIPTYLIAIAVGSIKSRRVGPRSRVWSEGAILEACAYEFDQTESMLKAAESLMGPYVWGDYDILILPPSFPYGGMENPCLTFATPTILAGDRSLVSLVAHEITHSWTGNLVTNRNWEHFWLNEGFTRFLEDKIIGILEGEQSRQFAMINGWSNLKDAVSRFGESHPLTALVPTLRGIDPDDAFSSIPYEKGSAFLYYIETLVGGQDVFNPFLRCYIDKFKYLTVTTSDFKDFLYEYFSENIEHFDEIDWDSWLYKPGMPPINVIEMYDDSLAKECKNLSSQWIKAATEDTDDLRICDFESFTTSQKIQFLTNIYEQEHFSLAKTKTMAERYSLMKYENAEIKFIFLRLCVKVEWVDVYPQVIQLLVSLGRMKFVRPLYRELFCTNSGRELALSTFKKNADIYHTIASNMIAKDLGIHWDTRMKFNF